MFLRSLASGRGSFVKTVSVVPDGFEVAGRLWTVVLVAYVIIGYKMQQQMAHTIVLTTTQTPQFLLIHKKYFGITQVWNLYIFSIWKLYFINEMNEVLHKSTKTFYSTWQRQLVIQLIVLSMAIFINISILFARWQRFTMSLNRRARCQYSSEQRFCSWCYRLRRKVFSHGSELAQSCWPRQYFPDQDWQWPSRARWFKNLLNWSSE